MAGDKGVQLRSTNGVLRIYGLKRVTRTVRFRKHHDDALHNEAQKKQCAIQHVLDEVIAAGLKALRIKVGEES